MQPNHERELFGSQLKPESNRWRIWTWAVMLCFILQAIGLSYSPAVWQDEVQIVDAGRLHLEPGTDWNIRYYPGGTMVPYTSYLGPLLSELSYRLSGGSFVWFRLAGLVSACACSALCMSWLVRRGITGWAALAVSLLFLIDPCFERSYRGGRVDVLAFLAVLSACRLIGAAEGRSAKARGWLLGGAGLLTGILPWIWTTAVLLVPLVFAEIERVVQPRTEGGIRGWLKPVFPFVMGASASFIGLALPVLGHLQAAVAATVMHLQWDAGAANAAAGEEGGKLASALSVIRYSPFLPMLAVVGGIQRGNRLLFGAALAVIAFMAVTRYYLYRHLYIVPYLLPLAGAGLAWLGNLPVTGWRRRLMRLGPSLLAFGWAASLTFGVRNFVALQELPWRDHDALVSTLEKNIGRGPLAIYMGNYNVYFAGRELDWRMFRERFPLPGEEMEQIYSRCDVVLKAPPDDTEAFREQIRRLGFDEGTTLHVGDSKPPAFEKPRYGGLSYGPYRVYRKNLAR